MGGIYRGSRPRLGPLNKQIEQSIHRQVVNYLKTAFPNVLFRTDGGGLKLTKLQAITYSRMQACKGWPDLQIIHQAHGFIGMFLELKKDGERPYLKDGSLSASEHIQSQAACHEKLRKAGYYADFAIGFDDAVKKLNWFCGRADDGRPF